MFPYYPDMPAHTPARRARRLAPALCLLLAGLVPATAVHARDGRAREAAQSPATNHANAVLMRAISLVGTPYVWGGNTPETGFDCSGLVNYVFSDMLNLKLPRTSRELASLSAPAVDAAALATGDLVFFATRGTVTHVGIYVGDGRFIHAPRTGGTVRMERIDGRYWQTRYAGARRVLAALH